MVGCMVTLFVLVGMDRIVVMGMGMPLELASFKCV
jgi:hypothetical protein